MRDIASQMRRGKLVQLYREFGNISMQSGSDGHLIRLGTELGLIVPYLGLLHTARERLAPEFGFVAITIPLAIRAIRDSGDAAIQNLADDLQLYHTCESSPGKVARDLAVEIIARDPNSIYAYFVASSQSPADMSVNRLVEITVRGTEAGWKLDGTNICLLRRLFLASMEVLLFTGELNLLTKTSDNHRARRNANVTLVAALRAADEYLKLAPPDAVDLPRVLEIKMAVIILMRGSELSLDLDELKVRGLMRPYFKSLCLHSRPT